MAFTTGASSATLASELVQHGTTTNGAAVLQDAANNAVFSLGNCPTNTMIVLWGVLCEVTTNWNNAGAAGAVFSYDASPT